MQYLKYTTGICAGLMLFFGGVVVAHAQMVVNFQNEPNALFSDANLLPGDSVTRYADVTNQYGDTRRVYIEALNEINDDNLGDVITLTVTDSNNTQLYSDTFSALFIAGPRFIKELSAGGEERYFFTAVFDSDAGDTYQEATMSFDFCIGFEGGTVECDDTTTPPTITPTSNGGGGGGGRTLVIFNEDDVVVPPSSADIVWETNLPASSQVFYGLKRTGPYDLDANAPNYGYPFSTAEVFNDVKTHVVTLPGLIPGETYVYRVASREHPTDPLTVSPEYEFTLAFLRVPTETPPAGAGQPLPGAPVGPLAVDDDSTPTEEPPEERDEAQPEEDIDPTQAAAAFFGIPEHLLPQLECFFSLLLILLLIYIAWLIWDHVRNYKHTLSPYERSVRRVLFLITGVAVALGIVILLRYFCAIVPLIIALAALMLWLLAILTRGDKDKTTYI